MKKFLTPIGYFLVCLALAACHKENINKANSQTDNIPVTIANLAGKWLLVSDTTTTYGGINENTSITGVNYIGEAGDYYEFTSGGKLNFHTEDITGAENYKLSRDTVLVEYAYIDAPTGQVDSAYSPIYVVTGLTNHNCTMTTNNASFAGDAISTIKLSR